MVKLFEEKTI
jgi:hypothetical protein